MDEKFYFPDKQWMEIPSSVAYEEIYMYPGQDTVHTVILTAARPAKANILFFHGNAANVSKWVGQMKPLTDDGFGVVMMDYRGYGKSSGTPTHLAIAEDAQELFNMLREREDFKNTKLIVYGASIGTQVAAHITRDNLPAVDALVLDGMMASFTDVAVATSPAEYRDVVRTYVTSPYSAKEDITHISGIPLLVIHSEQDFLPIADAKAVYESAGMPKTFWQYEGEHVMALRLYPEEFVARINALLDEASSKK